MRAWGPPAPPADPEPPPFLEPRPIDLPAAVPLGRDADLSVLDDAKILAAPDDPADVPRWRAQLARWRDEARVRIGYSDALYRRPDLAWTASCGSVCLAWLWDELLYDRDGERFTPDRFLDDGVARFGGYDGVVLWHAYPVIGLDTRNQFDLYRDVPGLAALVRHLRARGVRVFLDYNPWDTGTRREPVDDLTALAALVGELDADGVFLDTMRAGAEGLRGALDAARSGVAIEAESRLPLARVHDHPLSWAQWFADSHVPGVLRTRWFERRHMSHHTRRWHRDHAPELRSAWLNGSGMLVWESVFGSWVGWNDRDRATLRDLVAAQRRFADLLLEGSWTPLADGPREAFDAAVHASRFELAGNILWTIVNASELDAEGILLEGEAPEGLRWFEPLSGRELVGERMRADAHGRRFRVEGRIAAGGIGAVLAVSDVDRGLRDWLRSRADAWDGDEPRSTAPAVRTAARVAPPVASGDAAGLREVGAYRGTLTVTSRLRETGLYGSAPFADEWKPLPPRLHRRVVDARPVDVPPFGIAPRPVTVGELRRFLSATGAQEQPHGDDDAPATGIDLEGARAYARWSGARLPTEDEWQVAAEQGLIEPGGVPVWEWTESEHTDGRTRWSLLKGGAETGVGGSEWYVEAGTRPPTESLKLLHRGAGSAASPSIGFRLAADVGRRALGSSTGERTWIDQVPSPVLGEPIRFVCHVPEAVGPLPLVLLLHGRGGHMLDWLPAIARLDSAMGSGGLPPMALVAPDAPWLERASWYVDSRSADGRPVASALLDDLLPALGERLPVSGDRDARVIAGVSMGGAGALTLALDRPDAFASVVCLSPATYELEPPEGSTVRASGAFGEGPVRFSAERYRSLGPRSLLDAWAGTHPLHVLLVASDREMVLPEADAGRHDLEQEAARLYHTLRRTRAIRARLRIVAGTHTWETWEPELERALGSLARQRGWRVALP